MEQSTLTSKGQTTIPALVRERMGLRPGDRILYDERDGEYVIRLHPGVAAVSGMFKHKAKRSLAPDAAGPDAAFDAERDAAREAWVREALDEATDATPEPR